MEVPRKRVRPAFYDDIDVMNEMIDDEITGEFDPDLPQEQQTKAYYQTVPTRMYNEALEKFKVISGSFCQMFHKIFRISVYVLLNNY